MRAMNGEFITPVAGGDVIRAPDILPTGRNIHAFDPFRMPTAYAMEDGALQAAELLKNPSTFAQDRRTGSLGIRQY